ncbi:hypothetical protein N657DRAFT_659378 [Parathielavia appendiculata]|uniref:Uncharacterized protein n=1 Tax=Parathielavia appendiculata TaxID=2587402 RepID=A0AAN6YYH4_9PEZI|nr:hypothetical protein N657DRAFT_659378 [Parathielavia appendiculata]
MVESSLHNGARLSQRPTVPLRGGQRRSSTSRNAVSEDSDSTDTNEEPDVRRSRHGDGDEPHGPSSETSGSRRCDMADPDRPYNMWRENDGTLVPMRGALLPDGYKHDTTIPGRPWICPVRSCRRLFKAPGHHRGSRLNDNLDGTFSVVGANSGTHPAVVVSRNPMDSEPIAEPTIPHYPGGRGTKTIRWVKAVGKNSPSDAPTTKTNVDAHATSVASDVRFEFAADGRPYREWWNEHGELMSMAGALIPEGYQLDPDSVPGRPWVCPIRSCRIACKFKKNLGYHFMTTHKSCSLNDNGDGTFSIVNSPHKLNAPRVVSRNPLDPKEPPPPAPRPPIQSSDARMADRPKITEPVSTGALSTGFNEAPDSSAAASTSSGQLWDHISSRAAWLPLDRESPEAKILLRYPKMRDLNIVSAPLLAAEANTRLVPSLILQAVGEENPNPCTECRRRDGPFDSCVGGPPELLRQLLPFLGSAARSCANCIARKNAGRCSVKRPYAGARAGLSEPVFKGQDDSVVPELLNDSGDERESAEAGLARRRSARVSLPNGDVDSDGGSEESADEASLDPGARPPRLVTFSVPNPTKSDRQLREPRAASLKGNGPVERDLHLEDWEMGDGRANTAGEPLAFSSTYLAANQTVQVSPNIKFQALSIPSGRVHQIPADATKTRVCTLATGKLAVHVGRDEFVIGSQGIFKINPGVACTVTNRGYGDVVLQITSVNGG